MIHFIVYEKISIKETIKSKTDHCKLIVNAANSLVSGPKNRIVILTSFDNISVHDTITFRANVVEHIYSTQPTDRTTGNHSTRLKNPKRNIKRLTSEEERSLLDECLIDGNGDKLVQQYWNLVFHTIQKVFHLKNVLYTNEDIEDLRSEVFVQTFKDDCRKLRQYKEGAGRSLVSWIMLITNSTVLNHLRKKKLECVPLPDNTSISIEEPEFAQEDQELMKKYIEQLPGNHRLIIKMHYFHGLSLQEISESLHKSIGAVYTAKSRAVERLKKFVETSDDLK